MPVFRAGGEEVLFVHVPKTGGTSIEQLFAKSGYQTLYRDTKTGPGSANRLRRCSPQHMHAALLDQVLDLGAFDFVFMLVREPLARFRSEYGMRAKEMRTDPGAVTSWAERAMKRYRSNNFALDNHMRPQAQFYVPGAHVYPLEMGMQAIVEDISGHLKAPLSSDIPRAMERRKATGVASGDVVIDDALARRLRAFYLEDYLKFGYPLA